MHSALTKRSSVEDRRMRLLLLSISFIALCSFFLILMYPEQLACAVRESSPGCWFRRLTGLACPGCGGTRAAGALLKGNILAAFQYNLFLPIAIIFLITEYIRMVRIYFLKGKDWRESLLYRRIIQGMLWLVLLWMFSRNLLEI